MNKNQVARILMYVWRNDRSRTYKYGEQREIDYKKPSKGERWATPHEIAEDWLKENGFNPHEDVKCGGRSDK